MHFFYNESVQDSKDIYIKPIMSLVLKMPTKYLYSRLQWERMVPTKYAC